MISTWVTLNAAMQLHLFLYKYTHPFVCFLIFNQTDNPGLKPVQRSFWFSGMTAYLEELVIFIDNTKPIDY